MKTGKQVLRITIAAAMSIFLLGCSFNVTTAKVEDAIMTTSIDENGTPGEEVVSYPADATTLYASAKIRNAPDNTKIRIVWNYITGDQKMDEITLDSGDISDRYIYSSFEPTSLLPEGDYAVSFYIEDRTEPDATVKFVVVAAEEKSTQTATDGAYLEEVHMTSYIDDNGYPSDMITTVAPTGTWYVSAILRNTQPDTMIRFVWYDSTNTMIDSYTFDPKGATDIYISGSLEITSIAPEGNYAVEIYVDDATKPAATVEFTVSDMTQSSAAQSADYKLFSQPESGFSIQYPSDWLSVGVKESNAAVFYPADYAIDGQSEINALVVLSMAGSAKGYTLDTMLQSWKDEIEKSKLDKYQFVDQTTTTVNGNDVAVYAYSWARDGYDLNSMTFLFMAGNDLYVITFTGTTSDFSTLYPYVEQMVRSFKIL